MKRLALALLMLAAFPAFAADKDESAFERVMRTRTLKCAYVLYPTFIDKDPNTGKMSGLYYDLTEAIGKELGVRVEWGPELPVDTGFQGIGKNFDANCSGFAPVPGRVNAVNFTTPPAYMPYVLYVRADEARFKTLEDFNADGVKIATLDGEISQTLVQEQFPKAKGVSFPGMSSTADRLESIIAGKVDAAPFDAPVGADYMAKNPGKLKAFPIYLRVGGTAIAIPHGEPDLKDALDITINTMLQTGALERIIKAHAKHPGTILAPAKPYEAAP